MSVELTFCLHSGCFSTRVSYSEYIARLPIKYDSLRRPIEHANGFVIYDKSIINKLFSLFVFTPFIPYKCLKLEIAMKDIGVLDAVCHGIDGWV